jgi:hypothetical protein
MDERKRDKRGKLLDQPDCDLALDNVGTIYIAEGVCTWGPGEAIGISN